MHEAFLPCALNLVPVFVGIVLRNQVIALRIEVRYFLSE